MALLARRALAAFSGCGSLRALSRAAVMALAAAVVMRATFVGTATGPPDFDQRGLGRRLGFGFSGFCRSFGFGRSFARGGGLGRSFRGADRLLRLLFRGCVRDRGLRRRGLDGRSLGRNLLGHFCYGRDIRQQRG